MARLVDPAFPPALAKQHDALIAAYERRLLASPTGLIETYPGEAYPTDVAAVAAAIAMHGRVTHVTHAAVLAPLGRARAPGADRSGSGLVIQRMDATTGRPHDAPRASGTALAAYFAGFADREVAKTLASGVLRARSRRASGSAGSANMRAVTTGAVTSTAVRSSSGLGLRDRIRARARTRIR